MPGEQAKASPGFPYTSGRGKVSPDSLVITEVKSTPYEDLPKKPLLMRLVVVGS